MISSETSKYLTDFSEPVGKRMRVLVDNKEQRDLRLFIFRIEYKGNVPVRSADFEMPIQARIPSNRKLVGVQKSPDVEGPLRFNKKTRDFVRETKPPINFEVEILDEHSFQIKPILMNSGEWLGIEIYTAAAEGTDSVIPADSVEKYKTLSSEISWSCHVAGVECPGTWDLDVDFDYWGFNAPWYLQVNVTHRGWSVYAILLFSIISLLLMVLLARASGWQTVSPIIQIVLFSMAIALSISSAEVAADWLFPNLFYDGQPVYAWVIFWLDVSAIIVLAVVAIWKRKRKIARLRRPVQQDEES
ncbi:MAG: hypothetical protein QOH63_665 [Acidobacteriota bacterium]|jgi:hypothetical protein|nr:hypothetical protein [Acidobacteriota bacterium]